MSRRPRAPLSLRLLAREESARPPLEIDAGATTRLADPVPDTGSVALAPGARERAATRWCPTSRRRRSSRSRLRSTSCPPRSSARRSRCAGSSCASRRRRPRGPSSSRPSRAAVPDPLAAAVGRCEAHGRARAACHAARPRSHREARPARVPRGALPLVGRAGRERSGARRACTTACPIGAISGAAATPHGLELRLDPGGRARRGLLVVGRRRRAARSSPPRSQPRSLPNRRTLTFCQPRTLKFRPARADAEHKEAPGNAGVPRT